MYLGPSAAPLSAPCFGNAQGIRANRDQARTQLGSLRLGQLGPDPGHHDRHPSHLLQEGRGPWRGRPSLDRLLGLCQHRGLAHHRLNGTHSWRPRGLPRLQEALLHGFFLMGIAATASLPVVSQGQWLLCLALYILSAVSYSGANIFYDAFLVDVTQTKRMDWISSSGFAWGYAGSCIPFVLCMALISKPGVVGLEALAATRLAFIINCALVVHLCDSDDSQCAPDPLPARP